MQDKFLKGLYRFFSVTFVVSFLMYASGGCKMTKNQVDDVVHDTTHITSTFDPETENACKEKQTTSDTSTTGNESSTTK